MTTDLPTSKLFTVMFKQQLNHVLGVKEMLHQFLGELEGTGKWGDIRLAWSLF